MPANIIIILYAIVIESIRRLFGPNTYHSLFARNVAVLHVYGFSSARDHVKKSVIYVFHDPQNIDSSSLRAVTLHLHKIMRKF